MAWYRCGGDGVPASVKTDMNDVLNKKFGTSTDYPPADWAPTVNLMGPLPEKTQASASVCSFDDGADDVPTKSLIVTIPPTLSGVSLLNEKQTGRNLLNPTYLEDGYSLGADGLPMIVAKRIATTTPVPIHGGNITISYSTSVNTVQFMYATFSNGTLIERVAGKTNGSTINAQNADEIYISLYDTQSSDITGGSVVTNVQIEVGSTAHDYEPYQTPSTYTASLGRTIYGGTADIVNGTGTDSGVKYTLDGTQTVTMFSTTDTNVKRFSVSIPSDSITTTTDRTDIISDVLPTATNSITSAGGKGIHYRTNGSHNVIVCFGSDVSLSSEAEYNAYVSEHNIEIVYTLATPTDFTFTGQEIPTRLGYNAFWSDSGDTEVTYRADIDLLLGGN